MTSRRTLVTAILFILFAAGGIWFAGASTYDFFLHLDGQVHAIQCSYVPGDAARDELGTSGCYAVMMSPYSSVLRDFTWAGIPIALPGLAVFLYMLFIGIVFLISGKHGKRGEAGYLLVASLLPLVTSIAYYVIAVTKVGEICKMCVGIYVMSIGMFLAALVQFILARKDPAPAENALRNQILRWLAYFGEGLLVVGLSVIVYLAVKPEYKDRNCGELVKPEDRAGIMIASQNPGNGIPAIEIVDPLCPSCEVFRNRLNASTVGPKLDAKIVLFPLDSECNWMLKEPVHHGACMVSRAVICSQEPQKVIDWALANNEELRETAKTKGPEALRAMILQNFADVEACLDSPVAKQKLNLSLRWAVANSLSMLTPQLYVNNQRLCDEDMDLGLEYGLGRLINKAGQTEGGN